jgi:hypothetical protein
MPRWLAVVAAMLVSGCGGTLHFHGDEAFTAEERATIERANAWLTGKIGDEPDAIVWDLPHGEDSRMSIVKASSYPLDRGYSGQGRIYLAERYSGQESLLILAAHEFAHFHGYVHHEGRGLMNHEPYELVWTPEDAASR